RSPDRGAHPAAQRIAVAQHPFARLRGACQLGVGHRRDRLFLSVGHQLQSGRSRPGPSSTRDRSPFPAHHDPSLEPRHGAGRYACRVAPGSVERPLNVIMTIGSRRRLDLENLVPVVSDYAGASGAPAAERMRERDKASILDLGLPLRTERDVLDENTVYYRIDSARSAAVLDLTTQEYTVLLAASRAWDDAAAGGAAR